MADIDGWEYWNCIDYDQVDHKVAISLLAVDGKNLLNALQCNKKVSSFKTDAELKRQFPSAVVFSAFICSLDSSFGIKAEPLLSSLFQATSTASLHSIHILLQFFHLLFQ